jgi:hypothetical protein
MSGLSPCSFDSLKPAVHHPLGSVAGPWPFHGESDQMVSVCRHSAPLKHVAEWVLTWTMSPGT